ncbi:Hypothetical protein A7982_10230 [Minicystis rosea]|nr:Hypothetical protein A7982_10230 [Minicystis rosea]
MSGLRDARVEVSRQRHQRLSGGSRFRVTRGRNRTPGIARPVRRGKPSWNGFNASPIRCSSYCRVRRGTSVREGRRGVHVRAT